MIPLATLNGITTRRVARGLRFECFVHGGGEEIRSQESGVRSQKATCFLLPTSEFGGGDRSQESEGYLLPASEFGGGVRSQESEGYLLPASDF
jgi:hypothetical protein